MLFVRTKPTFFHYRFPYSTPDFDSAGGTMADVVANTAKLSADDRRAIAEYIKSVPAIENGN